MGETASQFSNLCFCEFCFIVRRYVFVSVFGRGVFVFASKFECLSDSSLFFIGFSNNRAPLASVNSFVVVDSKTQ